MRARVLARSATLAALGWCAALLLPCATLAASDASSTEAYVRANYALVLAGHRDTHAARAKVAALRERLRRECPRVVAGSPQDEDSEKLTWEVIGAMTIVGYRPGMAAATRFSRAVSKLKWSSAALTRSVHAYARKGLAEVSTPLPDVCGDLRVWKATGYTALPQSTVHFRQSFYENYVGVGFMPNQLARLVPASLKALVQRARRYEEAIAEVEALEVETFGEIIDSLGLNQ
jgi:hypothetical protein